MAVVILDLQNITEEQVNHIVREYDSMPTPDYRDATSKARTAASHNRRETWTMFSLAHVNATLMGLRKIKYNESYSITKLLVAVEYYAYATLAQGALTFDEFNLSIGPVANELAPELFVSAQHWNIEPISPIELVRPAYKIPRRKQKTSEDSILDLVDTLVKEAVGGQATPSVRPVQSATDDTAALSILLGATKKAGT
jgi:hypothetical protein